MKPLSTSELDRLARQPLGYVTEQRLFDAWRGVLWDNDGRRVLPTTSAFDEAARRWSFCLSRHGFSGDVFAACEQGPCGRLYHLPTVEWIGALASAITQLSCRRVLEVGAGDGFVSACLRRALPSDVEVLACDDGSWEIKPRYYDVVRADGFSLARERHPDFVLWCWPPIGPQAESCGATVAAIVALGTIYLDVGEGEDGATSGWWSVPSQLRHGLLAQRIEALSHEYGRCRTDCLYDSGASLLHTEATLVQETGRPQRKARRQ